MTNILALDSLYIFNPLRRIYLFIVKRLLNKKISSKNKLILYRLDKDNIFIRDIRNVSGMSTQSHIDNIDVLSIKFYRYLKKTNSCGELKIKNQKLYDLYTRQVKLKLGGLLRCAYRIQNLSNSNENILEVISDRQTISIMKVAFLFLNFCSNDIQWKSDKSLTACITINSMIMRTAAIVKMIITPTNLPKEYLYKYISHDAPSVLITLPKRRPEDFYKSYIEKLGNKFNIYIYSNGHLKITPNGYQRIKIKRKFGVLHGLFKLSHLCFSSNSYIADILIIFKNHSNLGMSIDIVNSLFKNKIDAHISRLQTDALNNFMAIEAERRQILILGDIMEEIFYCDFCICASESAFTESVKLALKDENKITFKESNSLIQYRLLNFTFKKNLYLHKLLGVDLNKKVIFYASDPSKEESQRYLTEKFLFKYFSNNPDFIFVIKTHTQDDGKITNYAYLDAGQPSNIILIGDVTQKKRIASKQFNIFDDFDFNSAIAKSNGFLTSSSSSILQALVLRKKSGIVDLFNNGSYKYLIKYNAVSKIDDNKSLDSFLNNNQSYITNDTLRYFGLIDDNKFNLGEYLQTSLEQYYKDR